ncbi:hypothetical protein FVEG_17718 [Fusarium verticillioides 7600]|uniref:Uncharacterized protein n=2 Tax=Fusarium TaxID=5506 RepID=W7N893_GIBM7|nr:hypothetical protein FVEG_17718 [Fusarium verticillioides 7600]XP_044673708.1 hypothetical protein J7337_013847 [Fusarium musae]EWG55964.1 hypothetical protein FVEG_17718 [Fusarium verticillioides 7600]KAG9494708.1 hypothetical protein J7337_013847 [Fusarium musae]
MTPSEEIGYIDANDCVVLHKRANVTERMIPVGYTPRRHVDRLEHANFHPPHGPQKRNHLIVRDHLHQLDQRRVQKLDLLDGRIAVHGSRGRFASVIPGCILNLVDGSLEAIFCLELDPMYDPEYTHVFPISL